MKQYRWSLLVFACVFFTSAAFAAGEYCPPDRLQSYSPTAGITHQTARLTDPTGQQVALFDMSWGGMLVSLKYNGLEYIAAPTTQAGAQLILQAPNYTPTQGGDNLNRGSTVTGVACGQNYLWLTTGMTDYNRNAVASTAFVFRNSQWYFDHFMAPYTISTYAYFVPNPAGSPAYYLKLDHAVTNLDFTESYLFTHDQILTTPTRTPYGRFLPSCSSGCAVSSTPYVVAGTYSSNAYLDGIAIATLPQANWPNESGSVTFLSESLYQHRKLHIKRSSWRVDPLNGKKHTAYVMVGSWANASSYASKACAFSVSLPAIDIIDYPGKSENFTVTTGAGCQWQVWTDNPSLISVPGGVRTGAGSVTITVLANASTQIRTGNLFIAGREYPYFQRAHP